MCCACGGGRFDDSIDAGGIGKCRNTNILNGEITDDRDGDACEKYTEANADWCGNYDWYDFSSKKMCCACGGGITLED